MAYRKKLIEVALPLEAINAASAAEKANPFLKGHHRQLHLWWARRPLAAARAVIFTSLVDDPDNPDALPAFVEACKQLPKGKNVAANGDTPRMRLFDFIERLVTWEATTDEVILDQARKLILIATEGNPPPLLDPFAGGGAIPLEAQRLGLEAHASDLNPVAVMINKAQIEIPPRFADLPPVNPHDRQRMNSSEGWKGAAGLAADVRYYGEWMREKAWERIGHLYPTKNGETVIAWIWARTVKSPNPAVNVHVPLVRSFILSKKKGRECWAKPIVEPVGTQNTGFKNGSLQSHNIRFEVMKGTPPKGKDGTVVRTGATCIISGEPIPFEYIREEGKAGRIGTILMAIVTDGTNGRSYYSPDAQQAQIADVPIPEETPRTSLPEKALSFRVQVYGMDEHYKLFTPRQLTALTTFSNLIQESREQAYIDALAAGLHADGIPLRDGGSSALAYAEAISVYLSLALSKWTDYHNTICTWNTTNENIRNLFARQAIPMTWDFAEANALGLKLSFNQSFTSIAQLLEDMLLENTLVGYANQQDAAQINYNKPISLSTDPPYYDNIGYADLSDFFYIWMRRSLRDVYPDEFATVLVPKEPELIASPYRYGGKESANRHFENGLHQTFQNIRLFITPDYPLTVYYAFKQQDVESGDEKDDDVKANSKASEYITNTGWETMLTSLVESGFSIDGTWPMRTERDARSVSIGTNALASSIILVCRPRPQNALTISRRGFVDTLRRELPTALKEMQSGNIAPVDLAQASIGPGMAIYSRYSKVLEADGSSMNVRTALGLINQELDTYLAEQDGNIDADTRFAIAWFEQFGFNEGDFGLADNLARAKNSSVDGISRAGLVQSGRGKVRLIHWKEYDAGLWNPKEDHRPTIWEATHHLIERLNTHGERGSAMLMTQMPSDMAAEARNLAYRLYSICERKGWSDHAQDYNALVISWAEIGDVAARLRDEAIEGTATEQGRLFE